MFKETKECICVYNYIYMYIYTVGVRPMGYRKTACFEALVLEPHFDQILEKAHVCASAFSCLFRTKIGPLLWNIYIFKYQYKLSK